MQGITLAALCGLCLGYLLGRHSGYQEGCKEGIAHAPLMLRATALQQGKCPVCDRDAPSEANLDVNYTQT